MDSERTLRRGMSLSTKLIGSMFLMLLMIMAAVLFSFLKSEQADNRLTLLSDSLIPLINRTSNLTIYVLEQEVTIERLIRHWEEGDIDPLLVAQEHERFFAESKRVKAELTSALNIVVTSLGNPTITRGEAIAFAESKVGFHQISDDHDAFVRHASELLGLEGQRSTEILRTYNARLDEEMDSLAAELQSALTKTEAFTKRDAEILIAGEFEAHQLAALVAVRDLGKRDAWKRLEMLHG